MSENELSHVKFQNSLILKSNAFQQAEMYFQSHKYEEAIEYYSLCIQQNETKDKNSNLATSYSNIGRKYDNQGKCKKAVEYYSNALEIRKLIRGENHPEIALSYIHIGNLYYNQGDYKNTLSYYLKSLEIYKGLQGGNHPNISTS